MSHSFVSLVSHDLPSCRPPPLRGRGLGVGFGLFPRVTLHFTLGFAQVVPDSRGLKRKSSGSIQLERSRFVGF
jgi:hypothetical protein